MEFEERPINKKYTVAIYWTSKEKEDEVQTFITPDLEKTMEQWGRNRDSFKWVLISHGDEDKGWGPV